MEARTAGGIRKRKNRGGDWEWVGSISYMEGGKQIRKTKALGIPCDPLTDEEKAAGRKFVPTGKGATRALREFESWRASVLDDKARTEERDALPEPSKLTTGDYIDYYLTTLRNLEASSAKTNSYIAKHIKGSPALAKPLCDLTTDDVEAWMRELEENGVGNATQVKAYTLLKSACTYAQRAGHIKANPLLPVKPPKRDRPKPNPLDDEAVKTLNTAMDTVDAEDGGKWRITNAVRIAVLSGMRQGEICGLRWKDVEGWKKGEFVGRTILVSNVIARAAGSTYNKPYPKNRNERSIPINKELASVLKTCRAKLLEECMLEGVPFTGELYVLGKAVSPDEVGTGYLSPMYLGHMWNMLVRTTSVVGTRGGKPKFHDLRHTFATHLIANGIDVETTAQLLGHDPVMTLRTYADYLPKKGRDAMDRSGSVLGARKRGEVVNLGATGTE